MRKYLNKEDLKKIIFDGYSTNIFLHPETKTKNRKGDRDYIENYYLPNIITDGDKYITFTEGDAIIKPQLSLLGVRMYYSYTNLNSAFINFNSHVQNVSDAKIEMQVMSLSRYRETRFILKKKYEKIYDSLNTNEGVSDDVIRAITEGKNFRVALQDNNMVWHIHNVDLPFYFLDDKTFQFQTNLHTIPRVLKNPKTFQQLITENIPDLLKSPELAREVSMSGQFPVASSYYSVFLDGTYQGDEDLIANRHSKYNRLLIHTEILNE